MLKFIYKIMIVSLLSGSLMLMDFSYKGIQLQAAHAESVKTDGIKEGSGLFATITMTSIGILTSRLMQYKVTSDMMVAAAGGIAFVAGDIIAVSKLKKVAKDLEMEITRDDKGKIDNKQIEALEKLKKSYEEAKKTANTKKTLQTTAAAAFAAAGVMAYFFAAEETTALTTCSAAVDVAISAGLTTCITSSAASCAGPQFAACYPPLLAACEACAGAIVANEGTRVAYMMEKEVPKPSVGGFTSLMLETKADQAQLAALTGTCLTPQSKPMQGAVTSACLALAPMVDMNSTSGTMTAFHSRKNENQLLASILNLNLGPIDVQRTSKSENIFQKFSELIIPTAKADLFSPMGITASSAVALVLALNTSYAMEIDMMLLSPKNRGIIFGVLAGLAYAAASATETAIGQIDQNIAKIDGILNHMYGLNTGSMAANPNLAKPRILEKKTDDFKIDALKSNESVDVSDNTSGGTPCFTKEKNGKCEEFGKELTASEGFSKLPTATQAELKNYAALGEGLNRKGVISGGTLANAAKLAGQANALRASLEKAKKDIDSRYANNKKLGKTASVSELEKKFSDKLNAALVKNLKNSKMSAGQMLASFGSGSMYNTGGVKPDSTLPSGEAGGKKAFAVKAIDIGAPGTVAAPDLGGADALAANELSPEEQAAALATASANAPTIDDYDLKNDISKDKDTSIFELISNRYQKSGYQRLFKRVK